MTVPLISPGVHVREIDLTTIVPRVSTTEGAIAGVFRWGPVGQRVLVDSETKLHGTFGKPKNFNQETYFTASAFLAYGNRLYVSRAANTSGKSPSVTANISTGNSTVTLSTGNTSELSVGMIVISGNGVTPGAKVDSIINSTAFTLEDSDDAIANVTDESLQLVTNTAFSAVGNTAAVANLEFQIVKNENHFTEKDGNFDTDVKFVARYPGELGNSLRVSVCGNSDGFSSQINLQSYGETAMMTVNTGSNTATVEVTGASNTDVAANVTTLSGLFNVTDLVEVGNTFLGTQFLKITAVGDQVNYGVDSNTVSVNTTSGNTTVVTSNTANLANGMRITAADSDAVNNRVITEVLNSTAFTVDLAPTANLTGNSITASPRTTFELSFVDDFTLSENFVYSSETSDQTNVKRHWEFFNLVDEAPGQSDHVINFGNSSINNDEIHVVVVDEGGKFTGIPGTVLETYRSVSLATDAKSVDGQNNFWRDRINDASTFVYAVNDLSGFSSASAENLANSTLDVSSIDFKLGRDGADESNVPVGVLTNAWDLFKSKEDVDVAILLQGKARSSVLANYLMDNIAEKRKDCVACVSPQRGDVVNNEGFEADAVVSFRNSLRSSSYGIMDSGYKYVYDRYNDLFRWVPLNGDVGGLMVRTDFTNAPWFSPAGFNRGQVKNLVKLAWNPRQSERDTLYKAGVNPVTSFPGRGTVLFGDKTLLAKPSAFNRINVRRLFIVLEKAISRASEFMLFEFNDEFTRSQFKNLVVPYLRDIQGRRGITDFVVVCDETNNTPEVIDRNEFIGDIYIKPARSINFVQLNFVAVRTGASFSSVINTF